MGFSIPEGYSKSLPWLTVLAQANIGKCPSTGLSDDVSAVDTPSVDEEEDWRLAFEGDWMYGASLQRRVFTARTPDWEHEHCVPCQDRFMESPNDALHTGLAWNYDRSHAPPPLEARLVENLNAPDGFQSGVESPTEEQWICGECFGDFKARFGWSAID
jgi:hypothetical protein